MPSSYHERFKPALMKHVELSGRDNAFREFTRPGCLQTCRDGKVCRGSGGGDVSISQHGR